MARHTRRLAALCVVGVLALTAEDSREAARKTNNDAAALYTQGRFEAAEQLYRTALSRSADDPVTAATIASNLGALYKRVYRYPEAEQMYTQALGLRREHLPPIRPEIADSMNNLAEVYRLEGHYWQGRNLAEGAVLALQQADAQSPDMPIFLNNWAGLERDLGNADRAEELLHRAWSLAEKAGGPGQRPLALIMNTLAQVDSDKHDYRSAEQLFARASAIFEVVPDGKPYYLAVTLANLGRMQLLLGRIEDAGGSEARARAVLESDPHADRLLLAAILCNLGNIEAANGNLPRALEYFEESLKARERLLGRDHLSNAQVLFDYAAAAAHAGERARAHKLQKRAEELMARRKQDDLSRHTVDVSAFVHASR